MSQSLGKLEKVEIRKVWPKEDAHFTPWLAQEENINLLAEELNIGIEVLGLEEYVGPFRADILAKDTATDHYIIIENQYGKTDHSHLGQIITYASGLKATTIVWISEKFTEEHRSALDWLNGITSDDVEFFGVEIELYKIGDSAPAPMFHIVSKPNNWSKTVKRKSMEVGLTDTKMLQQEYWQAFKDYVETQKVSFRFPKPQPQHWISIAVGRSGFTLNTIVNTQKKYVCVQLVVYGANALENFQKLRNLYEEDSKIKLSPQIEWLEKEGKEHHVNYVIQDADPTNKDDWKRQHKLFCEWVDKFSVYFRDKVKGI